MSTHPRGPEKVKHTFATRGRVVRKRSEEEEEGRKRRGRIDGIPNSESDEREGSSEGSLSEEEEEGMGKSEMAKALMEALREEEVSDFLIEKFSNRCKELISEETEAIKKDVNDISKRTLVCEEKVLVLEKKADDTEQLARATNVIVSGAPADISKPDLAKLLREKLKIAVFSSNDIKYIVKLGSDDSKPQSLKVALKTKDKRDEIYKKKAALKGDNTMWITEDLTPTRNRLFYLARRWAKNKEGALSWTAEGKVFLKKTKDGRPMRINYEKDIPDE